MTKAPGTIVTFYSFKGGVGRSMALANVAVLLARAGKKVLCVDWDLEAPGLDRYFRAASRSSSPVLSQPGRSGGLLGILQGSTSRELARWQDYLCTRTGNDNSKLDFISSGEDNGNYSTRLSNFSWAEFFERSQGSEIIEALRADWKDAYDFILIDSRTGLTDSSGICTIQLPDLVVLLFAANEQNIDWSQRVAKGIREGRKKLSYDRTFLPIIPVLSRFDAREESDRAATAMDRIAIAFRPFFEDWLPRSVSARDMLAWNVLPYVPRYSFEEALAVDDEPETGAQGLSFYYRLLAQLIEGRFQKVRSILASVGVPGASLPPLLPNRQQLDLELQRDPSAIRRYLPLIKERAIEEPLEATKALEILSTICVAVSRIQDAEFLLNEAISILSDPSVANANEISRLKRVRAELSASFGTGSRRFRVAFSFSGRERDFVESVANILARRFGKEAIFYDKFHEAEFARPDLGVYLPRLYLEQADLTVIVFGPGNDSEQWTAREWRNTELLIKTPGKQVMLGRFGHASVRGIPSTLGFIELDNKSAKQFAELILERIAHNEGLPKNHYLKSISSAHATETSIPNNLPRLQSFFGREEELKTIREALNSQSRTWGALIDGPGGMGKTSLAVRAAYDCPPGQFDRIIFLSTKSRELDDDGIRELSGFILPGLLEMLNELARELGMPDITKSSEDRRIGLLLDALRDSRILLILDNLESLTKPDRDQLFTFVKRLPQGCKAILTSRRRIGSSADTLILEKLSQEAALETLADLATLNPFLAKTSETERTKLYAQTGGKPLLLHWIAGQLGRGRCRTFTDALGFLLACPPDNDPLEFIFGDLASEFTAEETEVLCALTYFTQPAKMEHITSITTLNEELVEGALRILANRSLVVPDQEETQYALVPMVADFLRRHRPEVVAQTGHRLERRAFDLIQENGYREFDRFPILDAAWPSVAPAIPLFLAQGNDRIKTVCKALMFFLDFTGRWDEWLSLAQQAETIALASGDYLNAGWRASEVGWVYFLRRQADAVLACSERVMAHWQLAFGKDGRIAPRERSVAIRLRGIGCELKLDYPAAIAAYREVIELDRSLSTESWEVANHLNDLAEAEFHSRDFEGAKRHFLEALHIAREGAHSPGIAIYIGNLAALALAQKEWPAAEILAREALFLSEKLSRHKFIAFNCNNLAESLIRQERGEDGLPYAQRAVDIYSRLNAPELEKALETLAECEK